MRKNAFEITDSRRIARLRIPILLILLVSCKTLPTRAPLDIVNWLPPDSDVVLGMVVPGNDALIDMLITRIGGQPGQWRGIISRSSMVALALEWDEPDEKRTLANTPIHAALIGTWPKNFIAAALGSDWKKSRRHKRRFHGPLDMELTVLSRNELILSRGQSNLILSRIAQSSESPLTRQYHSWENDADLKIWIGDPAPFLRNLSIFPIANMDGSPILKAINLTLSAQDNGDYALLIRLVPTDEEFAASLALATKLALSARFGLSSNPQERALLSDLQIDVESGSLRVIMPSLSLELLGGFLDNLQLFHNS